MTDTDPMPCELDRLSGNVAYAARHGNSPWLNTAPPLSGAELRKWQARWRKTHGLDQGENHA